MSCSKEVLDCFVEARRFHSYLTKCLTRDCTPMEIKLFQDLSNETALQIKKIKNLYQREEF